MDNNKLCCRKDDRAMHPIYECPETLKTEPSSRHGCQLSHSQLYPECQLGSKPI